MERESARRRQRARRARRRSRGVARAGRPVEASGSGDPPRAPAAERDADVLKVPEAASLLGVSRDVVYAAVGRRELPHRRLGRRILFSRSALLAWLEAGEGRPQP